MLDVTSGGGCSLNGCISASSSVADSSCKGVENADGTESSRGIDIVYIT